MRRAIVMLLVLAALGCEDPPAPANVTSQTEAITEQPVAPEVVVETPAPAWPPPIPGLLLEKLEIEREGSFEQAEGNEVLTPHAAVALGEGLALVGDMRAGSEPEAASWRWIGLVADETSSTKFDAGSIRAATSDGKGGARLAGSGSDAHAWFGSLDARGELTQSIDLDGDAPVDIVDILPGRDGNESAVLLGNVGGQGWVVSLDRRGRVRWQSHVGDSSSTTIHAGARVLDELLAVGTQIEPNSEAWWGQLDADAHLEQGTFEIDGADPQRTLDAIVPLGYDMGFIALGRAKREAVQDHDQVIAVGFDHGGQPTWSRSVDHFRAIEIYGGAVHHGLRGVAHFVARVPIDGEGHTALAWVEICPGVDGVFVTRQLAGTIGWESAGFIEGRDDGAILAYSRTAAGIDWRVLLIGTSHVWG